MTLIIAIQRKLRRNCNSLKGKRTLNRKTIHSYTNIYRLKQNFYDFIPIEIIEYDTRNARQQLSHIENT